MENAIDDMIEPPEAKPAFLDTIGARLLSVIIAGVAAFLLFVAHEYYVGSSGGILGGVDKSAFQACVEQRMAAFGTLAEQAGFDDARRASAEQAARASANVICAEQARPGTS